MEHSTLHNLLHLQMTPQLGPVLIKNLIAYCGSAERVLKEKTTNLAKIPGIGKQIGDNIKSVKEEDIEKELHYIEANDIVPLYFLEANYPERLKDLDDAPPLLFFKGQGALNKPKTLGIVGTRRATSYGKDMVHKIVEDLAGFDITIVSGLAHGIDEASHQAALKNDLPTIGVLAHGMKYLYPAQNANLSEKMLSQGGLLTEFPSTMKPLPDNFPARNRIIAGTIDGLLIAETGEKGGALITGEIAYSYNREIMALPGKSTDNRSTGCNQLIKQHKAYLVENGTDVAFHLGWEKPGKSGKQQKKQEPVETSQEEDIVLRSLNKDEKVHINKLAYDLAYPVSQLSVILFTMEMKGLVKALPGDNYAPA